MTSTGPADLLASTTLNAGSGTVLTVGAGMEFATLADALKSSVAGDTIAVQAGTYLNDFGVVTSAVRIVAVGGIVNEVATVPPPDDKGLLTVDASLSIQGFTFTGGSDGSPDGNVSGIRLENGNLNVSYCYFHDMQEGLLADYDPTATVTIDHSEFARNGTGDGLSHNLYVGGVASLTVTNSYFHDANVGHEIKSRAAVTTIENNVIADGPTGTASYDIDLPNAGVATISGNLIEKGPMASNRPAIHYGGETQLAYANNSLSVTGNTILNDFGPLGNVVLNASAVNGLTVGASITDNNLYGFDPAAMLLGAGTLSGNTILQTEPSYTAPVTWSAMPTVSIAAGPQVLNLINLNHVVTGGQAHLTINDRDGSNTIHGGAGGLTLAANGAWDQITTQAGASDTINLIGSGAVLNAAGNDHITASGLYDEVYATGAATIASAGSDSYTLAGTGEQLTATAGCVVSVASSGSAHVTDAGGDMRLLVAAGGHVVLSDQAATVQGGSAARATVTGAADGWISGSGVVSLTTHDSGAVVRAGTGWVNVTGGAGADTLTAGSGSDVFALGGGADQIVFGSGSATVTGGAGVDTYHFHHGDAGHDTIVGFKQGTDSLKFEGFSGKLPVASGIVAGGNTTLTLIDGTTIVLAGVSLKAYAGGGGGTAPTPTPGQSSGGAPSSQSGSVVLNTGGQTIVGNGSLLTVTDLAGGNTIQGGSGGLSVTAAWNDLISTMAGTTNQLTLTRADTLTGAGFDQVTATDAGDSITEQGTASVTLQNTGALVTGGAGLVSVTDALGGNTVAGGAGGIAANLAGLYDQVTTQAGASDAVSIAGGSTIVSQGNDRIAVQGNYNQVTVSGASSIVSGSTNSSFDLEGADTLSAAGGGVVVGQHASAAIDVTGADGLSVGKLDGGSVSVSVSAVLAGGPSTLDLSGGIATITASAGTYGSLSATIGSGVDVVAGAGAANVTAVASGSAADTVLGGGGDLIVNSAAQGVVFTAGSGNVTLNGGAGDDVFTGGAGSALLNLGSGADTVTLGSGTIVAQGGLADSFIVSAGASGTLIVQNWGSQDRLVTADATHGAGQGGADPAILSQSVVGGSTWLALSGGAHVELVGVTHFT